MINVGALAVTNGLFSVLNHLPSQIEMNCNGSEKSLDECTISILSSDSCTTNSAGVICQGADHMSYCTDVN